jgi:hypothetical protein
MLKGKSVRNSPAQAHKEICELAGVLLCSKREKGNTTKKSKGEKMKLMTKAITKAAQKQYPLGSSFDQKIVAKFFDPLIIKFYIDNKLIIVDNTSHEYIYERIRIKKVTQRYWPQSVKTF